MSHSPTSVRSDAGVPSIQPSPEQHSPDDEIASLTERVRRLEVAVFDIVLPAFWNGRRLNNAEMARVIDLCPEGPREASDGRVGS